MKRLYLAGMLAIALGCSGSDSLLRHAKPFVGDSYLGHCDPCASVPFGMIRVGPESGNCAWEYTGGYQYSDSTLNGFSHTRINGTGSSDLGDLLIMPFTGEPVREDYRSRICKEHECAEPGYYSVTLEDHDVDVEISNSGRVAIYRMCFGQAPARVMVDFQSGTVGSWNRFHSRVLDAEQDFSGADKGELSGYCHSSAWLERMCHYDVQFDRPYKVVAELPLRDPREKAHRYVLEFDTKPGETMMMKVALSRSGVDGARANISAELPGWDFDAVRAQASRTWEDWLSRIEIEGTEEQKNIFYTSMYHLLLHPNLVSDACDAEPYYSTFSLWDTFRAAHPLFTILCSDKTGEFVSSFIAQYDRQGFLPIWALWGDENYGMIGNHAVPVVVDAYLKGIPGFDAEMAYEAVRTTLMSSHRKSDWATLDKYGYYPYDIVEVESVSRTLESIYDDHCAELMARSLGHTEDAEFFARRAGYYRNLFDPQTRLMRPRDSLGRWKEPFDPLEIGHWKSGGAYTEGNAVQYTWHVLHDFEEFAELLGGKEEMVRSLDEFFTMESTVRGTGPVVDVSGMIGQYAHGNEPSHHVIYFYTLAGRPDRAAELIEEICRTKYCDAVDGLCGNDDCGQMSAWYIFSALGFYPVDPCGGEYVLGAPQLPSAKIHLPSGKTFTMTAENYGPGNIYVKEVWLNGKRHDARTISHSDILQGSRLKFVMSPEPTVW